MPRPIVDAATTEETTDNGLVTELTVSVSPAPKRHKRPTPHGSILPDAFPPGAWAEAGRRGVEGKAVAEYQYLRHVAGICRSCPNPVKRDWKTRRYKHRCPECATKEYQRRKAKREAGKEQPVPTGLRRRLPGSKYRNAGSHWKRLRTREAAKEGTE